MKEEDNVHPIWYRAEKQIEEKMKRYVFDPFEYGFEPIFKYPELLPFYNDLSYVKILSFGDYDGLVYWYVVCRQLGHDDRIEISLGSYDTRPYAKNSPAKTTYLGLISNEKFAKNLLYHLFGTTRNESVQVEGRKRYDENLGDEIRQKFKQEKLTHGVKYSKQ